MPSKHNPERSSGLKIPLSFEETVSNLLKVKPPPKPEKPARKTARSKKRPARKRR
jgi:hypothetical protein